MTIRGHLINYFPALHLLMIFAAIFHLFFCASVKSGLLVIFVIWLLPVFCFQLHNKAAPLQEGTLELQNNHYSPWWGAHQMQGVFNALPFLEGILRIFPGVYSFWLRMWGSTIGRNVHWTAQVDITDRNLLQVGDNVIVGHRAGCYAHAITIRCDRQILYLRRITIGNNVLIGAGTCIGPGAMIADNTLLPRLSIVNMNQHVGPS